MSTLLDEIKEQVAEYRKPLHKGNFTAQKYLKHVTHLMEELERLEKLVPLDNVSKDEPYVDLYEGMR